jgi:hypothetical protein
LHPYIFTLVNIFPDFLSFLGNQTGDKEYKNRTRERERERESYRGRETKGKALLLVGLKSDQ